jgi:hypothetical protein
MMDDATTDITIKNPCYETREKVMTDMQVEIPGLFVPPGSQV